eukprot:2911205-Lingulodinium_polyedra.AAC.1
MRSQHGRVKYCQPCFLVLRCPSTVHMSRRANRRGRRGTQDGVEGVLLGWNGQSAGSEGAG